MTRCLDCGVLIRSGSRCSMCAPEGDSRGHAWSRRIVPLVLMRDGHRCVMCGAPCPHPRHHHVDHIIRRADGGSDALGNLRTVCASYNLSGRCRPLPLGGPVA